MYVYTLYMCVCLLDCDIKCIFFRSKKPAGHCGQLYWQIKAQINLKKKKKKRNSSVNLIATNFPQTEAKKCVLLLLLLGASQVAPVIKNPPANTGNAREEV